MTIKQFVKSKTFKCILVLLGIALVSGALLSILNDLFKVTDEERVMRTIKGIYGTEMGYEEVETDYATERGIIENVYKLSDGNYLIKSKGLDGYKKGTITVWVVALFEDGKFKGIDNASIADYEKQTLMSKFNSSVLNKYQGNKEDFSVVVSGATFSSTAMNNAINTAVEFINKTLAVSGGAE